MVANTDLISAVEYNYSRNLVSDILTSYGYTATASTVTGGTTIVSAQAAAYQWLALVVDMNKCAGHQGTTLTLPSAGRIASGNLVYATDITLFRTAADLLYTNRYNIAAGQFSLEQLAAPTRNDTYPSSYWGAAAGSIQHNFTLTFTSGTVATNFFNAGGTVLWNATRSGGAATLQNSNWTTLLNTLGTMTYRALGTTWGSTGQNVGSFGYYGTSTSAANQLLTQGGTLVQNGFYNDNDCTINVSKSVDGSVISFNVIFRDDDKNVAIGINPTANYDYVDGLLSAFVKINRPTGDNITVPAPTYGYTAHLT
jgi:hypothetical protein